MTSPSASTPQANESVVRRAQAPAGFSLVEVTLALGIIGFVLLALISLMSVGLQAGKEARDDMVSAQLAQTQLANLATNAFENLPADTTVYFNLDGLETNASSAYYLVRTRATPSILLDQDAQSQSKRVRIDVAWPAAAPEKARQTNVIETHLAKFPQ